MIEIQGLYKKYEEHIIYENFNLTLHENEITSILGASGCGKTTLLKILAGLENYQRGNIKGIANKEIAVIFQEDRLIPWLSVYENIRFVLKSHMAETKIEEEINKILMVLKLHQYKDYLPSKLSGGMQRRVAIGRAFAYPYQLLLMDEPFKGLDSQLKKEIIQDFLELWRERKKTIICITHQLEEAAVISNNIIELVNRPIEWRRIK